MKQGTTAGAQWRHLSASDFLSDLDAARLREVCWQVLRDPEPTSPVLRRDARSFATALQDFLAYGRLDAVESPLDYLAEQLATDFSLPCDLELLATARWNAVTVEEPLSSVSTAASSLTSSEIAGELLPLSGELWDDGRLFQRFWKSKVISARPPLLQIHHALKKITSFHCKLALRQLQDTQDGLHLLTQYSKLWNVYSAAALTFHQLFSPVSKSLMKTYDQKWTGGEVGPEFHYVRMMALIWRRKVFEALQKPLFAALSVLVANQRSHILSHCTEQPKRKMSFDDEESIAIASAVQAIVDLSVHERNVHFLEHSQFETDGPYYQFHSLLLAESTSFLQSLSPSVESTPHTLSADLKFLKRISLPCTHQSIQRLYAAHELRIWESHFMRIYATQWPAVFADRRTETMLNSEFGALIFRNSGGNKARVRDFIAYLLAVDHENESRMWRVQELIAVATGHANSRQDEEIEYYAGKLECTLKDMRGDVDLYSFSRDVALEDLAAVITRREDMEVCEQ